ncbi:MAG: hypothetical protein JW985_01560 [Alphaproteobacteria bacterium]|nr:hypothetical protein [Alphaproteobacteria bacterium]
MQKETIIIEKSKIEKVFRRQVIKPLDGFYPATVWDNFYNGGLIAIKTWFALGLIDSAEYGKYSTEFIKYAITKSQTNVIREKQ